MDFTSPHYDRSALLTIDLQRDFLDDGVSSIAGTIDVLPAVRELARAYRAARRPIVHVVRLYLPDGSNVDISRRSAVAAGQTVVQPGTWGAQLAPGLTPTTVDLDGDLLLRGGLQEVAPNEYAMYKPRWNAFYGSCLDGWLRRHDIDTVVVAGCNYPNCPRGTLFGASERDYRAVAVGDAISQWLPGARHELAGIGVHTATVDEVAGRLRDISEAEPTPGTG